MPIGAVTIWDTSKKNKDLLRHTLHILPPFQDHNKSVWFILDGQQRLSVLHRVSVGGATQNGSHQSVDFDRVVFRVTDGEEQPRFQYRKPIPGEWVPVSHVLASNWRHRLKGLTMGQINRAMRCRDSIRHYRVPIVQVTSESLGDARVLFIRINSLGTPLGAADKAFARASKFDLRERAEDTWQKLPHSFQGLRYEMLLQTRALIDGINDVGEKAFEQMAKRWDQAIESDPKSRQLFDRSWTLQFRAICRAIDCLKQHFSVLDNGLLPSEYMLSTLTVYFYHRDAQPSGNQLVELRKWFWSTALGQRYSGRGFRENILKDAAFFQKLAHAKAARFYYGDRVDPEDLQRSVYGQRSSISDAMYCLLISSKPAYLANGHTMLVEEYASSLNRKHKHHIFPKALLYRSGVSVKRANSILNLCFISAEENISFASRRPNIYLKDFRNKRYFSRVMRSHLIPFDQKSGLWDENIARGYKIFLKARTRELCKAFEKEAGIKLFRTE